MPKNQNEALIGSLTFEVLADMLFQEELTENIDRIVELITDEPKRLELLKYPTEDNFYTKSKLFFSLTEIQQRRLFSEWNTHERIEIINGTSEKEEIISIFNFIPEEQHIDVFNALDDYKRGRVLLALPKEKSILLISQLMSDEQISMSDLYPELFNLIPETQQLRVFRALNSISKVNVLATLSEEESIMLMSNLTISEAAEIVEASIDRGHTSTRGYPSAIFHSISKAQQSILLKTLKNSSRGRVLEDLPKERITALMLELTIHEQAEIISSAGQKRLHRFFGFIPDHNQVEIFKTFNEEDKAIILSDSTYAPILMSQLTVDEQVQIFSNCSDDIVSSFNFIPESQQIAVFKALNRDNKISLSRTLSIEKTLSLLKELSITELTELVYFRYDPNKRIFQLLSESQQIAVLKELDNTSADELLIFSVDDDNSANFLYCASRIEKSTIKQLARIIATVGSESLRRNIGEENIEKFFSLIAKDQQLMVFNELDDNGKSKLLRNLSQEKSSELMATLTNGEDTETKQLTKQNLKNVIKPQDIKLANVMTFLAFTLCIKLLIKESHPIIGNALLLIGIVKATTEWVAPLFSIDKPGQDEKSNNFEIKP